MATYEHIVREIRQAAEDEAAWPQMLGHLSDYLGLVEATLGGGGPGAIPTMVAPRTNPSEVERYLTTYHTENRLMRQFVSQAPGQISFDHAMPDYLGFTREAFYNEWCLPQRYRSAFGVSFATSAGWHGALMLNTSKAIETGQVARFAALLPLFTRSLEVNSMLHQFRSLARASLDVLDFSGQSALLLDRNGRVLEGNNGLGSLLRVGRLSIRDGRLSFAAPAADLQVAQLIASCLIHPDQMSDMRLQIETAGGPLIIQCAPYPGGARFPDGRRPAAILIFTDPLRRLRQRLRKVQHDYGLTAAETELAMALVQTGSRKAAADRRGVSDATARAQLTSIFDKTGIRKQTDLVRLLMASD